ncbi:MAG: cofactor-independent phosphoglycerate mutase [Anaerocolumna sp.]
MKYIIVLGDGMADEPIEELGGKTPLGAANTKTLDYLAKKSEIGLCKTVPEGMSPGSDTANLSVLGYDPKIYYSGRSPLEALSIGVDMKDSDIAIRCNVVTVSEGDGPYENRTIIDHSASEISTAEAAVLLQAVKDELENGTYTFYVGTSYRHLTIWDRGSVVSLTPPHDILGKEIKNYLPEETMLKMMMEKSYEILNNHPINIARSEKGLNKANSIWFWGAGTKPSLDSFEEKFGKTGTMISAVDLLKGIAVGAKMKVVEVEGADGTLHTNYEGKAMAAVRELTENNQDFVYIHVEAPDEMGHQGSMLNKIKAIEYLDERVIKVVKEQMEALCIEYRMLVMPDHPTPIHLRTHTSNPVPYMLYDSTNEQNQEWEYTEAKAEKSGNYIKNGYEMILKLFQIS